MKFERFNKILVVDDSAANLQLLMHQLKEQGYTVYPASEGELALKFVQSTLPDLILLDIRMPGMDGYEVCRRLKADERTASVPVIFLSALEDERDKVKGFQIGGVDYITKPFQLEEMLARVRIHLRMRELAEGLEHEVGARTAELMVANKRLEEEIAERRQAEEALRESQQRLDNIVANSPGAIYRCAHDEHWTMEFISAGVTRITGYAAEDFLDNRVRSYVSIIHPDDRQSVADAVANALARKARYEVDYRLVAADGALRWVHEQGQGVFAPKGQLLYLDGVIIDITVQREAEEALRISSERLQLATRVAHIGIWDWDVLKNELLWDDSMYQLYGIQEGDFGGAYDAWIHTVHPEDMARTDGEIQAALHGEHEYADEFRIVRPDGSIRYIKADSKTFRDQDGNSVRMIGTNIDITERKQAEMEIHLLNLELEQRVAERTAQLEDAIYDLENFNYSASHDLRIPLRAIDGFSKILLDDYSAKLDAEGIRLLKVVRINTNRLAQFIDDMQAFSRTGRMAMAPVEIDMRALVRDVMEELKPVGAGRHIKLEIDSLPSVYADRAMLRWVFLNLLSNAIKFSRNQQTPRIRVGATIEAKETIYFVRDNGVGFDMQYEDKLFGIFERLHNVNEFEGTGIGLAIVKRIVSRHHGRVWAEGKVNEGATFYFALPNRQTEDE